MLFVRQRIFPYSNHLRFQGTLAFKQKNEAASEIQPKDSEYTEKPEYPEILDLSYEQRKIRKKQEWYEEIKNLKTVEEKLFKINMPRYYGYKTIALKDNFFPYNCLPLSQHYTRTIFNEIDNLPPSYQKNAKNVDSFVNYFKSSVQEAIEFTVHIFRRNQMSNVNQSKKVDEDLGEMLVQQINRLLINSLLADCSHLSNIEVDLNPRHEAFWFVGGVNPSKSAQRKRKLHEWTKKYVNDPYNRPVQYIGKPYLALRHKLPLEPVYPSNDANTVDDLSNVPLFKYDSRVLGYTTEHRHGTTIPGYWPGSPHEFGLLSYQRRDHVVNRDPSFGTDDLKEALHAQGIQSSFAWLYAQACYQGFSTFHDVTYPLSTQTIITNGQVFSFYVYQLNTTLIHSDHVYNNPRVNYCWGTKECKLFEEIDENGKCIGFNENVLKNLIHFYANEPVVRNGVELKPYLGIDEKRIADIQDEERRVFLEEKYKHMTSNRPRHLSVPEIYMWEKIYKIDNKTRQLEPKRRFFELDINPFRRTMDDHTPEYIPKFKRPDGPKSKKKWMKTYYP